MSGVDTAGPAASVAANPPAADASLGPDRPAFVTPRTYLEQGRPVMPSRALTAVDREQLDGLRTIRAFLKVRTSYDVLPLSFRLIILDTALLVKKSLNILIQNGAQRYWIAAET